MALRYRPSNDTVQVLPRPDDSHNWRAVGVRRPCDARPTMPLSASGLSCRPSSTMRPSTRPPTRCRRLPPLSTQNCSTARSRRCDVKARRRPLPPNQCSWTKRPARFDPAAADGFALPGHVELPTQKSNWRCAASRKAALAARRRAAFARGRSDMANTAKAGNSNATCGSSSLPGSRWRHSLAGRRRATCRNLPAGVVARRVRRDRRAGIDPARSPRRRHRAFAPGRVLLKASSDRPRHRVVQVELEVATITESPRRRSCAGPCRRTGLTIASS